MLLLLRKILLVDEYCLFAYRMDALRSRSNALHQLFNIYYKYSLFHFKRLRAPF